MTYALRLPPHLDASARAHAEYLGVSFNGFVCVAVDAYLRANPTPKQAKPAGDSAARPGVPPGPAMGGKSVRKMVKKETFKDRQRARDTAGRPEETVKNDSGSR